MFSFFGFRQAQAKSTIDYMEEAFNKKSENYKNLVEKTESWLNIGKKISISGAAIALYGKWQDDKEKKSLDFALKKRVFSGKTILDGGLGLIIVGFCVQTPFWYITHALCEEALQEKRKEETNKKLVRQKRYKS